MYICKASFWDDAYQSSVDVVAVFINPCGGDCENTTTVFSVGHKSQPKGWNEVSGNHKNIRT